MSQQKGQRKAATNSERDDHGAVWMLLDAFLDVEDCAGRLGDVTDVCNLHHKVEVAAQLFSQHAVKKITHSAGNVCTNPFRTNHFG